MVPLEEQFLVFLATVGIGVLAAFCFDLYRVAGRLFRFNVAVGDAIYWLLVTGLVFFLLLKTNEGEVRVYVLLGLAAGGWLYFRFASSRVVFALLTVFRFLCKIKK